MRELILSILISLTTGIVSGVISGLIVTIHYRKKDDIKNYWTSYLFQSLKYCNMDIPEQMISMLKLMGGYDRSVIKLWQIY